MDDTKINNRPSDDSVSKGLKLHTNGQRGQELDPSRNVLDLVDAAIQRQDDLRKAENSHIHEVASLQYEHAKDLRKAETARIDAVRAVDVAASQQAAKDAETRAATLAATVANSAETLRTQVQAAATAATIALAAALEPIIKDIADLRRVQYEGVGGKAQVTETQASNTGQRQSTSMVVAIIIGSFSILLGTIGLVISLIFGGK